MALSRPPPLPKDVEVVLNSAQQLVEWVSERQDSLEIKADNATRVPGVLLDLCLEHHVGIVQLITGRIYGSAFVLIRAQFESLVRALWLHLCAKPEELQAFLNKDALSLNFGQMLESIEKHDDFGDKALSGIKIQAWKAMHGYTHGGMHQIVRRMKGDTIEPNFEPEEIVEVLKASGFLALIALLQIGRLANSDQVIADVTKRLSGAC